MYGHKLGLALMGICSSHAEELTAMKRIGFEAYADGWGSLESLSANKKKADELGLSLAYVHAPFSPYAAELWHGDKESRERSLNVLLHCVEDCARVESPVVVLHAFIGFDRHEPTACGIEEYGKIVDRARTLGISVAFENTEGEEYLAALLSAFASEPHVGFCFDSGHEMCYNRSRDLLALYGDRLLVTHLNDNLGIRDFGGSITWIDDLHLLPFDGIADWNSVASRLRASRAVPALTFELTVSSKPNRHENDAYAALSPELFLTEAYKRACRVAALL